MFDFLNNDSSYAYENLWCKLHYMSKFEYTTIISSSRIFILSHFYKARNAVISKKKFQMTSECLLDTHWILLSSNNPISNSNIVKIN